MPTTSGNPSRIREIAARGVIWAFLLFVLDELFGKRLDALIEAIADRLDRTHHVHLNLDQLAVTIQHQALPVAPELEHAGPSTVTLPVAKNPEWFEAITHDGDGSPAFQPIDPTDADWPDPAPIDTENRTALVAPGTDLLAQIRATPNPSNVPMPNLAGEFDG